MKLAELSATKSDSRPVPDKILVAPLRKQTWQRKTAVFGNAASSERSETIRGLFGPHGQPAYERAISFRVQSSVAHRQFVSTLADKVSAATDWPSEYPVQTDSANQSVTPVSPFPSAALQVRPRGPTSTLHGRIMSLARP